MASQQIHDDMNYNNCRTNSSDSEVTHKKVNDSVITNSDISERAIGHKEKLIMLRHVQLRKKVNLNEPLFT